MGNTMKGTSLSSIGGYLILFSFCYAIAALLLPFGLDWSIFGTLIISAIILVAAGGTAEWVRGETD